MTHGTAADFARRHVEEIINSRRLDLADEQIVEVWVYPDTLSIMQQFGLIPTSGGA
jgi:hypothetical protein